MAKRRRSIRRVVSRARSYSRRHSRGSGMIGNLAGAGIAVAARKYAVPMVPQVAGSYTPILADVGIAAIGKFAVKGSVGKGMVLGGATIAIIDGLNLVLGSTAPAASGAGYI